MEKEPYFGLVFIRGPMAQKSHQKIPSWVRDPTINISGRERENVTQEINPPKEEGKNRNF